ncbi:G patch domain-containing protein 4-like [Orbicella faveolata]|uniref:G patch domain-containing protein 4-like n=1 Tax=Orbicella faveolata TaxID=48498 RepID=UPI0009E3C8BD|nr:G patch domain-containing protein 4-like [Orbicella faveolata]
MTDKDGFAKKQLEKHGWCEGKGLGKEESGISKAIKVNIKTDTAGVGYDAGDQFSFHWWDHVFNKTAKSIVVQESDEGVEVVKSSKDSCTVSSKRPSKNTNKPLLYGRFVKASSKTLDSVAPDSDDESDSERDFSHLCAEEKLFQACGGRTAHKAARHGLGLNGKLQRVEEQEKLAVTVDRCRSNTTQAGLKTLVVKEEREMTEKENNKKAKSSKKDKGMKKRKRKYKDVQIDNEQKFQDEHASRESESDQKRVKKKKKKKR